METRPRYSLDVANEVDSDGHYRVAIYRNGVVMRILYDNDREDAIDRAKSWVAIDRNHDPSNVQRIEL